MKVHGHRGARGRRPENTLPAIQYALQQGADGVEVDVCISKDDAIVLHHDLRLNPCTTRNSDGAWIENRTPIRALRLRELRRYDVGRLNPQRPYAQKFREQIAVDGAAPPTLDECVALIRRHCKHSRKNDIVLNLELKSDPRHAAYTPQPDEYVALVLRKLEQLQLAEHVVLQSFDWRLLRLIKQRRADLKVGFTQSQPCQPADLKRIKNYGGDVLCCDHQTLNKTRLQHARALGLEVYAWTVNEQPDIARMAKLGVDAIITDYPERCRDWLDSAKPMPNAHHSAPHETERQPRETDERFMNSVSQKTAPRQSSDPVSPLHLGDGEIWRGDNLPILQRMQSESIALIYIDPPFNTGKTQTRKSLKTVRADNPRDGDRLGFGGHRYHTTALHETGYTDAFHDYLEFLRLRLLEAHRILRANGSLFFHIDWRESARCRMLLEKIFGGAQHCINEIIWAYDYGARSKSKWATKHDNIYWFAKDPHNYIFNYDAIDRIPYMSPGLVGAEKAARGKTPTDTWWQTIVPTNSKEKTGYPTQKPLPILERIVRTHSQPADTVLDFFAGSGTTGAAARNNDRRFILIDENPTAINAMKVRLAGTGKQATGNN